MGNSALPWVEAAQAQQAKGAPLPWEEAAQGTAFNSPAEAIAAGASPEQVQAATAADALKISHGPTPVKPPTNAFGFPAENYDEHGNAIFGYLKDPISGETRPVTIDPQKFISLQGNVAAGGLGEIGGEFVVPAIRAARTMKLAEDAGEWQKINEALGVRPRSIAVSPSGTTGAESAVSMPGRALGKLGYTSADLQKMDPFVRMNMIDSHLQNAGAAISQAAKEATQAGTTLDVGGSAMNVFKGIKDPAMQERMIAQFNSTARELGITNLRQATPEQALALRQALRAGKAFSGFSDIQTAANVSKQLGSAVSSDLKQAVPSFSQLDQTYSDLRGARDAAVAQMKNSLAKAPPPSLVRRAGQFAVKKILPKAIVYGAGGAAAGAGYALLRDMRGGQP